MTATGTAPITYSIVGGADAALFTIDENTGALSFLAAPDFEAPADSGGDNIYDVTVQASNSTGTDTLAIAVTVSDVVEAAASGSVYAIDENNNLGVYSVPYQNTFTLIQNLGTNNADKVDALAYVNETILIGNKDNSSGPNFVRLEITGPNSVVETPITVTNAGSIPGGASGYSYDAGTYDGSTNTYYTTEENNTIFLAFTYDIGANTTYLPKFFCRIFQYER
ncbi:MAG: cadherin repeat domain-containing protein [Caldilineaceae bacterium]